MFTDLDQFILIINLLTLIDLFIPCWSVEGWLQQKKCVLGWLGWNLEQTENLIHTWLGLNRKKAIRAELSSHSIRILISKLVWVPAGLGLRRNVQFLGLIHPLQ